MAKVKSHPEGLFGEQYKHKAKDILSSRFIIPPFSVLNTREGWWQQRKRAWIAAGVHGELGRGFFDGDGTYEKSLGNSRDLQKKYKDSSPGGSPKPAMKQKKGAGKLVRGDGAGHALVTRGMAFNINDIDQARNNPDDEDVIGGTSIFDPVLCEVAYRWFCLPGGAILDPFAGESTKGIVAASMGYKYTGIELRQNQVDVNYKQAKLMKVDPVWLQSDSSKLDKVLPKGQQFDFIWTSPPYYDLEIYSNDSSDISAFSTYAQFMEWYEHIFSLAVARLHDNRFLAVKVSEIRDKKTGEYRNFVGDNIECFKRLGLHYYNDIVLLNVTGSLPLRVGKHFAVSRKVGRTHQNVLVFFKGDMKQIKPLFGDVLMVDD